MTPFIQIYPRNAMPDATQKILRKLSKMDADARNNVLMNTTVSDTVKRILESVEDDEVKLRVKKVWVDQKNDNKDIAAQKLVRNKSKVWGNDLRADLELVDKITGKAIDHVSSIKVTNIPKITDRGTFLVKGNEYQFTKQSRLKPGVYTKRQTNGEISSFFNVDKTVDFERGFNNNFKIKFNPEKKTFTMGYGAKNVPLINALRMVGVTEKELIERWGQSVYDANSKAYDKHANRDQNKLHEAIFGKLPEQGVSSTEVNKTIKERLFLTGLDPDTTKLTLGKPYKNVNKNVLLDASNKIIGIHKGDMEGDDREALVFKSFYDIEDHVREKLVKNSRKIINNIKFKLKKNRSINKSISSQVFDPFVIGIVTNSQLSNPPNQTNTMSIIGESSKFTVMGEGGIGTTNAITNETRQISNSEAGFVDPLHTPEGPGIGVAVHSTVDAIKVGNDLYGRFRTPKGEDILLNPIETWDQNIAFPDEYDTSKDKPKPLKRKIRVVNKGNIKEVAASQVDAIIASSEGMFDTSANSIPFLNSIQGNRGLTASKMQEQALPLKYRDKPVVRIVDEKNRSIGVMLAETMALPKAPVSGKVTKITSDNIVITDSKGKEHSTQLYDNFSLNAESYLHNEPKVQEGDKVKAGDLLADNNFTKDGQMAIGANLRTAYLPYKGYNYEDSAVMSESGAKKLTSLHMRDFKTKRSSKGVFSREKYRAYYPEEINAEQSKKLDSDGVIKKGQKVARDDVLIAHMEKRVPTADDKALGRLDKQLMRDMTNNAIKWDNDHAGTVTNVEKFGNSVMVSVKTEEPLKVADKISGLHGNKHIISKILPDHEMPYDPKSDKHIELTMNPIGVSNRINTSQILENAAGKIAEKTGRQYKVKNFSGEDNSQKVMDDLKKWGLSDKDILIDPETGKPFINPVANGMSNILKLEHIVEHKFSSRYKDGYDANEQPVSGGKTGGKNLARMEMAAMLARGANENLKEMFQLKGQKNDDFWKAMETGQSLPPPKKAFVWDKMLSMMAGAGINVEQKGKTFTLKPMTDEEVLDRSRGELKRPTETYRKKDLAPMREGLYDPVKAGGMFGDHYTHFKLPEKTLNPITAIAAASLSNMPLKTLDSVIAGKQFIEKTTGEIVKPGTPNSISGGPAVEILLNRVNVNRELKNAKEISQTVTNPSELNKVHRKIKYLQALKDNKMKPSDYMVSNVLVTPSKYRPMVAMGPDKVIIMSDINNLYQTAGKTAEALKNFKKELDDTVPNEDIKNLQLAENRGAVYQDLKAIAGLTEPTAYLHRLQDKKGYITQIDGGKKKQTKEGFFQDRVLERRQDLVGRSTIILNPDLGGDEIGLPKEMATKMFQPFIMRKMVSWGYKPGEAQKHIKDKTAIFERARQVVADERLIIANRAPTLHRWNMTAFKPKLTDGKSIEVPAVVIKENFGGDFDGDTFQLHTPVGAKALREAEKMKPSASMLKTGYDKVLNTPEADMVAGSWLMSKGKGGIKTNLKFKNVEEARFSFNNNVFTYGDSIEINGRKAPFGMHEINSILPDDSQQWNVELDSDNVKGWIRNVTKKHNGKIALGLADKIKDVGNNYVTKYGFTLGVSDTLADKKLRKALLDEAFQKSLSGEDKDIIQAYSNAAFKGKKLLEKKYGESTMLGIGIQSGAGKGIDNTSAITLMPGIVMDANDKAIPIPITKSYSEGLDTAGYWTAAHGARGGSIKKSVQSYMPGWLTKDLMNSIYDTRIHTDDPVDTEGLEYNIDDKKAIMNRYLARDVKDTGGAFIAKRNELINSDTMNKLVQNKVKSIFVQSPLTDPSPGDGFSSFSYGTDYEGSRHNIGDNIGIISAHTITEPSLNLAMKSFHTGGAFKGDDEDVAKQGTRFDKLNRTLRFTRNLPDKATLSDVDGVVKTVSKSSIGGWDVTLTDGKKDTNRYIDPNNKVSVSKGDTIKMGDKLSTGTPSAHDMLKYKGMKETQKFLVDQIDDINEGKLDRRDIETIVRGITNTTRVLDPGSSTYTPHDVAQLTSVEHYNKNNEKEEDVENSEGDHLAQNSGPYKKHQKINKQMISTLDKKGVKRLKVFKDRVKHEPFLTPAGISAKAASSEDWIARLAHNRIKKVLEEGTNQGWKSTIDPKKGHPIPSYITGEYTW